MKKLIIYILFILSSLNLLAQDSSTEIHSKEINQGEAICNLTQQLFEIYIYQYDLDDTSKKYVQLESFKQEVSSELEHIVQPYKALYKDAYAVMVWSDMGNSCSLDVETNGFLLAWLRGDFKFIETLIRVEKEQRMDSELIVKKE